MAGMYTVQMAGMRLGATDHRVRQALQANGIVINLDDQIEADDVEKNSSKLQKWLEDDMAAHMEAKNVEDKSAANDAHNAKVAKELEAAGSWDALARKNLEKSSKSEDKE